MDKEQQVIGGLGPVWDAFMDEVNLEVGLGFGRPGGAYSCGRGAEMLKGRVCVLGLGLEPTKEVWWVVL